MRRRSEKSNKPDLLQENRLVSQMRYSGSLSIQSGFAARIVMENREVVPGQPQFRELFWNQKFRFQQ